MCELSLSHEPPSEVNSGTPPTSEGFVTVSVFLSRVGGESKIIQLNIYVAPYNHILPISLKIDNIVAWLNVTFLTLPLILQGCNAPSEDKGSTQSIKAFFKSLHSKLDDHGVF